MINLLPLEEKKKLILRKKEKLATIWGIVVLVFVICLALILLAIRFYILAETDYQKSLLSQAEKEVQTPGFENLYSDIQKYNATLSQLDSFFKKEIYFNRALEIITGVSCPKGLFLTNFLLQRNAGGTIGVNVSGISDTRDNLLLFQKNIEAAKEIKNSYFSPASWINPKNVNFSLTFEINSTN